MYSFANNPENRLHGFKYVTYATPILYTIFGIVGY